MSSNAVLIVQFLFTSIWRLFTSWYIPGTNVTPAALSFMLLASFFILRWIKAYFLGGDD